MRKRSFLKNLTLFLLALLVPLTIFGVVTTVLVRIYSKDSINKNNGNLLLQTRENIELMLSEIDHLRLIYDVSPDIGFEMDNLFQGRGTTYERNQVLKIIMGYMISDVNSRPYIDSIYIYYDSGGRYFFSSDSGVNHLDSVLDTSWYDLYRDSPAGSLTWTVVRDRKRYFFESSATPVISVFSRMISRSGVIVLNISPQHIEKALQNIELYPEQRILVTDSNEKILFKTPGTDVELDMQEIISSKSASFTMKAKNEVYIVSQLPSEQFGLHYISIVPQRTLYRLSDNLLKLMIFLLVLTFFLGVVLAYKITDRNYRRISNIISVLDSAENGRPLPPMPDRIKDEYSYIISNILKTFIEHSYLEIALSEKKFRMKSMELIALQSQINPHFLFNTLKTIYWKSFALTDSQNEVSKMVENLSAILDYSLGDPKEFATMEEELRVAQSYTEIQLIRYHDKFDIVWDIAPQTLHLPVMKLFMQPLIENSIYHGVKEREGRSKIKVKVFCRRGVLSVRIVDNGAGIDPDALWGIREKLESSGDCSDHIGLFNTNKRLKLTYGDEYGLHIKSRKSLGTSVCIRIPAETEEEDPGCAKGS